MAVRSSNNILHAIRTEVFGENQTRFGKRLGLTKETILRLEGAKAGHRVSPKHLRWLKALRAPSGKAELMQALLGELEASIQEELRAEASSGEDAASAMPPTAQEGTGSELLRFADRSEDAARRAEEAAQRVEQLQREVEVRVEEAREQVEALRRVEAMAQRTEQLRAEDEARRMEEARRAAQAAREAEAATGRAEQDRVAAERRVLALLAASLVVGMFGGGLVQLTSQGEWSAASDTGRADSSRDLDSPDLPVEPEHWSGGLDAGTEPAKLLPIPKGGLPGQHAAPCPPGAEEINGFCWWRVSMTAEQVKSGFCEDRGLYEPSAGWCRANHAGYLPVRERRRPNNAVDAQ
ncbi:MAG TPA: hypothetical protein VK420_16525 [Longimicrobium sp.]|nr:hypothetical protein [Longimicrobium sp.]